MAFNVSAGEAYTVLYCVLAFFTLLALGAAGLFSCLPDVMTAFCTLKTAPDTKEADYFLSARNSAGTWSIAVSFFASGMGAWVSTVPTHTISLYTVLVLLTHTLHHHL